MSTEARKSIPKSVRFEVFKRDKFTCQYCGKKAPDVVLEVDHIHPVAEGGTNDLLNLLAACEGCNIGKGAKVLSDDSALVKARTQLEILQERREQLEMMMDWHRSLTDLSEQEVDFCLERWSQIAPGPLRANSAGRRLMKSWLKNYGMDEVIAAMGVCEQYVVVEGDATTKESWEAGFKRILTILKSRKLQRDNPKLSKAYHLKNIFVKQVKGTRMYVTWSVQKQAVQFIRELQDHGQTFKSILAVIRLCKRPEDVRLLNPSSEGMPPDVVERIREVTAAALAN